MKDFLAHFPIKNIGTYTTVIVVFTYNVLLDVDMGCKCKQEQKLQCNLYMTLPFFTLTVLIICMDKTFRGVSRFICTCKWDGLGSCRFCWLLVLRILKAGLVGLLWVITLLIDGDWYVCCQNKNNKNNSTEYSQLACKDKSNLTAEERLIIADLKSESKVYGFSILFGIICLAAIMSLFDWRKCCEGKSDCCERETLYDTLIIEEEENVLKEILREKAKEELTKKIKEKINSGALGECFNVSENLIKERATGRIPATTETSATPVTFVRMGTPEAVVVPTDETVTIFGTIRLSRTTGSAETAEHSSSSVTSEEARPSAIPGRSETARPSATPGRSETARTSATPGRSETARTSATPGRSETGGGIELESLLSTSWHQAHTQGFSPKGHWLWETMQCSHKNCNLSEEDRRQEEGNVKCEEEEEKTPLDPEEKKKQM
ncbi:uncharacterized protein LOC113145788 [Mastacembelus armatus]|uniref:uncharacterized protein LOC113145788 n=1 Tax=Mastacembelus armatus TaxID=205130 RepID=UPI000E4645CF|nr:uncharacterized protein LOC113145788 [Mastacembelus armatus]